MLSPLFFCSLFHFLLSLLFFIIAFFLLSFRSKMAGGSGKKKVLVTIMGIWIVIKCTHIFGDFVRSICTLLNILLPSLHSTLKLIANPCKNNLYSKMRKKKFCPLFLRICLLGTFQNALGNSKTLQFRLKVIYVLRK